MKITKLLESLIATQKEINKSIKDLKEEMNPKTENLKFCVNKVQSISDCINNLETNIYTKEETVKTINKEIDYRKEYEECKDENYALLELIEKYCKYDNKYRVIDLFKEIDNQYLVDKR